MFVGLKLREPRTRRILPLPAPPQAGSFSSPTSPLFQLATHGGRPYSGRSALNRASRRYVKGLGRPHRAGGLATGARELKCERPAMARPRCAGIPCIVGKELSEAVLSRYDTFVFDCDGVLWYAGELIKGTGALAVGTRLNLRRITGGGPRSRGAGRAAAQGQAPAVHHQQQHQDEGDVCQEV